MTLKLAPSMNDSGKLYFLKDRGRRLAARSARRRFEGPTASGSDRRKPSPQETLWLGRVLVVQAAYLGLYWLGIVSGLVSVEEQGELRLLVYSFLPADLFLGVVAAIGGYDLLQRPAKRDLFVVLAAGGLIFLALEQLTYGITASFRHQPLSPGERLEVTAMGISLCVGIWAVSHSLRMRAER